MPKVLVWLAMFLGEHQDKVDHLLVTGSLSDKITLEKIEIKVLQMAREPKDEESREGLEEHGMKSELRCVIRIPNLAQ